MNWDDVRYFLAVSREGSVSRAGQLLGVNHTTVARRINALEKALGTRLFDRSRDGFLMTQAAEDLFETAAAMEASALAFNRRAYGQDAELRGPLKVTVPYDFANTIIVPALAEFRAEFPCIDLELLTTTGLVDLAAREADLAVRLTDRPPEYLIGRELVALRHGIYGTPRYLRSVDGRPDVILFRSQSTLPHWVEANFPGARVVLRTDSLSTMREATEAGLGVARMPCFDCDTRRQLVRLRVETPPSTWSVWILNHVDLRSTARVRVCREFLIDTIQSRRSLILGENSTYADTDGTRAGA